MPGVAEYEDQGGGVLTPKLPTPGMCAPGSSSGIPVLPVVGGLAAAGLVALLLTR